MHVPDGLPQLTRGKTTSPMEGGCIMQVCDYLTSGQWTDHPLAVNPLLQHAAIRVNDSVDDADRQKLWDVIPGLINTEQNPSCPCCVARMLQLNERAALARTVDDLKDIVRQFHDIAGTPDAEVNPNCLERLAEVSTPYVYSYHSMVTEYTYTTSSNYTTYTNQINATLKSALFLSV